MNGPVIEFEGYRIKEISYNLILDDVEFEDNQTTHVRCSLTEDYDFGQVELTNSYQDKNNKREIKVTLLGQFKVNPELKDAEDIKYYLSSNGTAILYPYLRATISVISSLDSNTTIILPTVNVNELLSQKKFNNHE